MGDNNYSSGSGWKHYAAGLVSGVSMVIVGHPFDTVKETKWKGSSTRDECDYKLWYSRTARNGVGVVLAAGLKDNVVQVNTSSDRIMTITLVIDRDRDAADGYAGVLIGFAMELEMMKDARY
ncbi:hypothetical protein Tco_0453542 [Tanacetum coccineum]